MYPTRADAIPTIKVMEIGASVSSWVVDDVAVTSSDDVERRATLCLTPHDDDE